MTQRFIRFNRSKCPTALHSLISSPWHFSIKTITSSLVWWHRKVVWDHGSCNYQHQCYWKSDVTQKEAIFTGEVIFTFCYIYLICNKFASPRNITVWISLVAIKYKVDFPLTGDWNIRNKIMDFSSFEHFEHISIM